MSARNYTDEDYGTCRYMLENPESGLRARINNAGASLTVTRVQRLRLLNLVDGPVERTNDNDLVRLAGLGVKTAREAQRLGKASV